MSTTVRNALIVAALAAAVFLLPGGGTGADLTGSVLSTLIAASLIYLGWRLYREHRVDLESLGDTHRALFYGALATIVWAMAARGRLVGTTPGLLVWCALVGGAVYVLVVVYRRYRDLTY